MRAGRRDTLGLVAALGLLAAVLGAGAWYFGPWGQEVRLARADLVTLDRETALHPRSASAWYYFGTRLREKGVTPEAAAALQKALELRPDDNRVRLELGRTLLDLKQIDPAFQLAKEAAGREPSAVPPKELLARLYQRTGAYHKALEQWEAIVRVQPKNSDAWYYLAFCNLQLQRVGKAVEAGDRAIALAPDRPPYLRLRASIAAAVGDFSGAKRFYREAIRRDPGDPRSYHDLASFLLSQKLTPEEVPEAADAVTRLAQLDPENRYLPWHRARLAAARNDWQTAVQELRKVLQSTPEVREAYFELANAYYRLGDKRQGDTAMAAYQKRSELTRRIDDLRIRTEMSTKPELRFEIARLQREAGLLEDAEKSVREGLRLSPGSAQGRAELAAIRKARGAEER